MKLLLNDSMQLTKRDKKGGIVIPFFAALIMIMIGDLILTALGFSESSANPTMLDTIVGLAIDIVPIILVILYVKLIEKRTISSLGITKNNIAKNYSIGLLIGLVMICSTFIINLSLSSISLSMNPDGINWLFVLLAIFGYLIQGFNEELICRGFLMNSVASRKGPVVGIISNSVFFSLLHLLNPDVTVLSFINILLFGLVFSLIFYKTNNIWIVGAIHSIWNFFQGIVFGSQVSGLSTFSSIFKSTPVVGKDLLNGGAFGFEGGVVVTIVTLVTVIITFLLINKQLKNSIC